MTPEPIHPQIPAPDPAHDDLARASLARARHRTTPETPAEIEESADE